MSARIKDRIAKLIAMATDGRGNPHEAESAMRMAQALMRKHGIELIEMARHTGRKPSYNWTNGFCPVNTFLPSLIIPTWFSYLASGIAVFTDTLGRMKRLDEHGWCAEFCGEEQDVAFAVWLCGHLRDQARKLSSEHPGSRDAKNMFRKAYAVKMGVRMQQLKRGDAEEVKREDAATGTALAILQSEKIAARTERFGPQIFKEDEADFIGGPGAREGIEAAARQGLNRPLETGD